MSVKSVSVFYLVYYFCVQHGSKMFISVSNYVRQSDTVTLNFSCTVRGHYHNIIHIPWRARMT